MPALDRDRIGDLLRRAHLLQVPYLTICLIDYVKNFRDNMQFQANHPDFAAPSPLILFETQQTTNLRNFYEGGLWRAQALDKIAGTYLPSGAIRVCEWGCGPGRVIRHFRQINRDRFAEVFGTDYNQKTIGWCRRNIPDVHFDVNGLQPPLPYVEGHFDFLYSISVLTHLPREQQSEWVNELLRVIRPGGILFLTVHGDSFKSQLLPREQEEYEREGIVVRGNVKPGWAWYTTYHNPRFVREQLLNGLDIINSETFPEDHPKRQDRWIVRKRS
jgi:SAM-dependent methyltransferase